MRLASTTLLLILAISSTSYGQISAIVNTNVLDIDAGTFTSEQTVIITDDRITAIVNSSGATIPADARMIDGTGKYLIPGLWDMHVHLDDPEMWPHHLTRERKAAHLQLLVANGVTGVRDMGGGFDQILQWKNQIASGSLLGPEIVLAGPIVDGDPALWLGSAAVRDADHGKRVVQNLHRRGADFIKVYSALTPNSFFGIAEEARRLGIQYAGHLPLRVSPIAASEAGMNSIEHIIGLTYECTPDANEMRNEMDSSVGMQTYPWGVYLGSDSRIIQGFDTRHCADMINAFAKNDTWQVPTLRTLWGLSSRASDDHPERNQFVHSSHMENWQGNRSPNPQQAEARSLALGFNMQLVNAMNDAGVGILAGTDMAALPYTYPGFSLHNELELFVEAGLSAHDALKTATVNPAIFLGQEDAVGRVKTGLIADLLLLNQNPLDDISNTQNIFSVVVQGTLLDRSELDIILDNVKKRME